MSQDYLRKTFEVINQIIDEGKNNFKQRNQNGSDELFEKFIHKFYMYTPLEFLKKSNSEHLFKAAYETWRFIYNRQSHKPRKVRVFNPSLEKDGWESERTILELSTADSPFILDSVTARLTEFGYRIYEVIHPVLRLSRNNDGNITEIYEIDNKGVSLESVMHFQITNLHRNEDIKHLENEIANVLHFVNLTVKDWLVMQNKSIDIAKHFDNSNIPFDDDHVSEVKDFLNWVVNDNFTFFGCCDYDLVSKGDELSFHTVKGSELGIFRAHEHDAKPSGLTSIPYTFVDTTQNDSLVEITKSSRKSVVHRPVHMDYIGIKRFDDNGNTIGEHRILGLFTSSAYYQSARLIPIIRKKIAEVIRRSGFKTDSHSGKDLVTVLETYPRDELLQISEDDLFNICMGIVELSERPRTKLFVRKDRFSRFVSCLVFVARDRFTTLLREKVQNLLVDAYNGTVTDYYTQVTESPLARVHVMIKTDPENFIEPDITKLEETLAEATNSWINGLRDTLIRSEGERIGEKLYINYVNAFPESFKDLYHFGGTLRDIKKVEESYKKGTLALDLDLYQLENDDKDFYQLKLYHPGNQVTLSNIMPILENMGFLAIDELTFFIEPSDKEDGIWIHHFRLKLSRSVQINMSADEVSNLGEFKAKFEEALYRIWNRDVEDDYLNKLIIRANMQWRDVRLLRAYSKYTLQTDFPYSYDFIVSVIARHSQITKLLVELFNARFSPDILKKNRANDQEKILLQIQKELVKVESITDDRVIRQFLDTILATVRTNYFCKDNGKSKNYISFKLDCRKVPNLPLPVPYAEIFVYSYDVEGIHLRGGKVARGGLRWSDRIEDFRTEVLGLVKAQMVKNSVIVPVGSKGGFVVKHSISDGSRDEIMSQGKECYKTYLCGLLDITDNIKNGKIISPKNVVIHDDKDPYLVVAADKGTATFSDIANSISEKYGFWLGDAFASGGSVGYDHKKMGITAKGAWVSVQRHFMEMNIDCQKEDFTVLGIGDMSGDVFGNGMLLSKHIKLVGAFNHMHIFIDPEPNTAESYKMRRKLFNKARSTWLDYDQSIISKGGCIFDRSAKSISLTQEIKQLFDIEEDRISPDELIKKMLMSRVDLLWNGGIGTYVKSEAESNENAGDKANDSLRINGKDLRCKIVGEGGNLGFTQRGRIEYALNGGMINTDAIDNSAGVDCSDHEVNIKIALQKAVERKKITQEERNEILSSMTDEVSALVLKDNILQTQALTIAEQQGHILVEQKSRLISYLEEKGLLDRAVEFLPNEEVLTMRQITKKGLTRPELSVILAYSKLDIYEELINSNLPDDDCFLNDLAMYFPEKMQKGFIDEINSHELRREIIATNVCNSIVNRIGTTFFHRMKENTGMKGCDVARAYTISRNAFNLQEIWSDIEKLHGKIDVGVQTSLFLETSILIERTSSWFLRNMPHPLKASEIIGNFSSGIKEITDCLDTIISPIMKRARDNKLEKYVKLGVPKALAKRISNLEALASACDIVHVAKKGSVPINIVGGIYYDIGMKLNIGWLRFSANSLLSHSHWENLAVQTIKETLFDQQMHITASVIKVTCDNDISSGAIKAWYEKNTKAIMRYDNFIQDLKKQESITHSMLTIAIQRVDALCHT